MAQAVGPCSWITTIIVSYEANTMAADELVMQGARVSQSLKFAGSPKSEASEIMFRTSETILVSVRSD